MIARGIVIKILQQSFLLRLLLTLAASAQFISCVHVERIPESLHTQKIENMPFYPQESYQCGPSSLAGVLNYWSVHVMPDDVAREIFTATARGTLTLDMLLYVKKKGLNAEQYRGSIEDIKRNISSGYPVIVLVDYGGALYQMNHFMVVVGYNEHGILANSGVDKEKFILEKDFLKIWEKTNYWMLLIRQ
jgi:predicted double-glycine peptidase